MSRCPSSIFELFVLLSWIEMFYLAFRTILCLLLMVLSILWTNVENIFGKVGSFLCESWLAQIGQGDNENRKEFDLCHKKDTNGVKLPDKKKEGTSSNNPSERWPHCVNDNIKWGYY